MSKKDTVKRQATQAKLRCLRRKPVNYLEVPKSLWKRIKRLLPKQPKVRKAGRPALSNCLVLNTLWAVLWTGCQGKAVTRQLFGVSSRATQARFQQWPQQGLFAAIYDGAQVSVFIFRLFY